MNDNEQLDNILDEALSAYREAEPLAGIEDRVLQRLRLQPEARRFASWKWGAVAACAAVLGDRGVAWLARPHSNRSYTTARRSSQHFSSARNKKDDCAARDHRFE